MARTNEADVEWQEVTDDGTGFHRKRLGAAAGGEELGCSLYELAPGERSWPYHYHTANEEAVYVLSGEGRIRLDDGTHDLRAGDYVALPADVSGGHRIENASEGPLRYLVVSTMTEPDVTVYPDSGKFGIFVGAAPGGTGERSLDGFYRTDDDVGYWEDE